VNSTPSEILREGCAILDPLLRKYGFSYLKGLAGHGSGGTYASGAYTNGERKLEFSYRFSLGLVTYFFGALSIDHEYYMYFVPAARGNHRYPGFSGDPLSGFHSLAYDLEHFAGSFLEGDFAQFSECVLATRNWKKLPGLARLS
jgi:hypothetical protein